MVLRAIFWITVVALLMPHGASSPCEPETHCSHALALLDRIRASGLHSLEQVRVDIQTDEQARAQRG